MADMADFALDQVWDMEDLRFDYRSGGMSNQSAYDLGIIDEMGGEHYNPPFSRKKAPISCKYCGEQAVSWKQFPDGKWRLQKANGSVHTCSSYGKINQVKQGISSDGFC